MALTRTVTLLLGATALVLTPALAPDMPYSFLQADKAFAKGGNGGDNGGGKGGGKGGGNGGGGNKGGGNGGGKVAKTGSGKSSDKGSFGFFKKSGGSTKQAKSGSGKGIDKFLSDVFGSDKKSGKTRTANRGSGKKLTKEQRTSLASVSATPTLSPNLKEKNLHAKLGRLNSLQRNYHAYMNSNDPHLASVVDYINSTLDYEKAAAAFETLSTEYLDELAKIEELSKTLDGLEYLDGIGELEGVDLASMSEDQLNDYIAELEAQKAALVTEMENIDLNAEPVEGELTPAELQAQLDGQIQSYEATIGALNDISNNADVDLDGFQSLQSDYDTAQGELKDLEEASSEDALKQALIDMAQPNKIAEAGGEEAYLDSGVYDWASEVIDGKIDQIRDATQDPEAAEAAVEEPDAAVEEPDETASADTGTETNQDGLRLTQLD